MHLSKVPPMVVFTIGRFILFIIDIIFVVFLYFLKLFCIFLGGVPNWLNYESAWDEQCWGAHPRITPQVLLICPRTIFSCDDIRAQPIGLKFSFLFSILLGMLILFKHKVTSLKRLGLDLLIVASLKMMLIGLKVIVSIKIPFVKKIQLT